MSSSPSFLLQEAMLMHQQGQVAEAAARYSQVLKREPKNIDALYFSGLACCQQGRLAEAVKLLRMSVKIAPTHAAAHNLLGLALKDMEKPQDALQSFRLAITHQPTFAEAYVNCANILLTLERLDEAAKIYDLALTAMPAFFIGWCNRGIVLDLAGRHPEAVASYDRAIALKPDFAEAHANRGNALALMARNDEALVSFDHAIAAKPNFVEVYINRGNALRKLGRLDEALASYSQAITIQPQFGEAHFSRGNVLEDQDRLEAAIENYDRALALKPFNDNPILQARVWARRAGAFNLLGRFDEAFVAATRTIELAGDDDESIYSVSYIELVHGRWLEAWPKYERRLRLDIGSLANFTAPSFPRWNGEKLNDELLVLMGEQGLGDQIQFSRYAPFLARQGYRVALCVDPRLETLLATVPGVERVVSNVSELGSGEMRWLPLMSLPYVLGTTPQTIPETVPFLHADQERVEIWRQKLGSSGFKIGIAWQGNPGHRMDKSRSVSLREFAPIAEIPDVRLISLQKELGSEQIANTPLAVPIETLSDEFATSGSFVDTAAIIMNLDLVITVDTAVGHLAGALGRPAFLALRRVNDWRWLLGRDDTPWYPSIRLFRQTKDGEWPDVFQRMADAVRGAAR